MKMTSMTNTKITKRTEGVSIALVLFFILACAMQNGLAGTFDITGSFTPNFEGTPEFYVSDPYPTNPETEVTRPTGNLSVQVNGSDLEIHFYFINMTPYPTDTFTEICNWTGESTGRFEYTDFALDFDNEFLWSNTEYTWYVNATNGTAWSNTTYTYTTIATSNGADARLDVDNDNNVFVGDLNSVWASRTGQATYDGIYDVDNDGNIFVGDLNTIWAGRS